MEEELVAFNTACDEFMAGKFIFPEVKIGAILKIIDADDKLKSIVAHAKQRYNFDEIFANMLENASMDVPNNDEELIAFVYGLLANFANKTLRFNDFIAKIKTETEGAEFKEFVNNILLPFKDAVINAFSNLRVDTPQGEQPSTPFDKLKTAIKLILQNEDGFKLKMAEKEEFTMLLNALYLACERGDKKMVYSLMIGLDYFTKCFKKCRNAYYSLEECFAKN